MTTYLALFIVATSSSLVLTPLVRRMCQRLEWLDLPSKGRRVHEKAVPRLGGVGIFMAVLVGLSILLFVNNLVTQELAPQHWALFTILLPAFFVLLLGIYDDLHKVSPLVKFACISIAGTLFFVLGGRIEAISIPFIGSIAVPAILSFALTMFWVVGITNAFNLIDGVDGLAAGAALFSSLVILVVSLIQGHPFVTVVALVLSGSLVGFLRYNFNPASIFLGDSGSLFVGFMLATLSVEGTQKASTAVAVAIPVLAFGLPVVDTGFTLIRRFISRKPLFEGDREHIHHMLLARGWSQRRVALVLYGVCALFGLLALIFVDNSEHVTGLMLVVVGAAVIVGVGHLRYHEVDEFKASVKRNLGERRVRAANNIRVRRASRSLSRADSLNDILRSIVEMLDMNEFAYATVRVGSSEAAQNERAIIRALDDGQGIRVSLEEGLVCWSWERAGIDRHDVIGSGSYWTLRLPLTTTRGSWGYLNLYRAFDSPDLLLNINYLCNLFQREMADAAERIFTFEESEQVVPAFSLSTASTGK